MIRIHAVIPPGYALCRRFCQDPAFAVFARHLIFAPTPPSGDSVKAGVHAASAHDPETDQ